ncbi:MAG: DUF58 domain-containing protein [Spirochaetaceae bacterium]|jgi:uncharacterized protein (DUF58 family)|nr:DUF58 domain-containing protein [Spirochaetaceae bacterium]
MERGELLRKITTFPIIAASLAEDLLSGDFRSVFRGEGIEFEEVRCYEQGDDIRAIDRNVSARFGKPYVKIYREERELTVYVVLDCSASMFAGGAADSKTVMTRFDQAVLTAALLGFSADKAGQRFGAVFFDSQVRRIFRPGKGRNRTMAIISTALQTKPEAKGSGLGAAIAGAGRILKRRSLVVIISDFLCNDWETELSRISQKHDFIAIRITDPLDTLMPNVGLVNLEDPETGKKIIAGTSFSSFRSTWEDFGNEQKNLWSGLCRKHGCAQVELSTSQDAIPVLRSFFQGRRQNHA